MSVLYTFVLSGDACLTSESFTPLSSTDWPGRLQTQGTCGVQNSMKHNQVVANIHYKKWWQRYVRTWFDQAGRKQRRRKTRQEKAAAVAPRPTGGKLRPMVHGMTQRYNSKARGLNLRSCQCKKIGYTAVSPSQRSQLTS